MNISFYKKKVCDLKKKKKKKMSSPAQTNKNPVGDWDVDDLLFWRALESHPPIQGLLKQVLENGWTLCIPPDTSILIGYETNNNDKTKKLVPMPTESFSKMHVLIPLDANGIPLVVSSSNQGQQQNQNRRGSSVDLVGLLNSENHHHHNGNNSSDTRSNASGDDSSSSNSKKNPENKSFAQTILAPVNSLRSRTASFFTSLKNSVTSNKNGTGNSPPQQKDTNNSPRKSNASSISPRTNQNQNQTLNNNNNNNNNFGTRSTFLSDGISNQSPFQFSTFIAGGRRDYVVYRRTVAEELVCQQEEEDAEAEAEAEAERLKNNITMNDKNNNKNKNTNNHNNNNNNRNVENQDEEYYYEDEEEYFDEADRTFKKRRRRILSRRGGGARNSLLREICKKKRFSDDSHSKSLESSDLGVLVAEWTTTTTTTPSKTGNQNPNQQQQQQQQHQNQKKQKTVARIVFEQKVINTESKKAVTFLVLDRPLNAGPGAVPAHLRTFGFNGQSVTDAVDFLFDADAEFVNDNDSLFSLLEKKAATARSHLDETYCAKLDHQLEEEKEDKIEDETTKQQQQEFNNSNNNARDILAQVREYLDETIDAESETWNMAIVPAAHPLSRRRLERSFQIAVSSFLHAKVYQIVFGLCSDERCNPECVVGEVARWKAVRRKFDAVAGGDDDPVHLGLAPDVWDSLRRHDSALAAAVQKSIDSVSAATNPFDKVQRLERVYQSVLAVPETSTTNLNNNNNNNASKITSLAADNVIPLLAYYLLRSERCDMLPVHLFYIRWFGNETVLGGASSNHEYALATLEVALSVACSVFDPSPPPPPSSSSARRVSGGSRNGGNDDDDDDDEDGEEEKEKEERPKRTPILGSNKNAPSSGPDGKKASINRFEASVIRSTQQF